jgi:anti-sigma factor RsiW
MNCHEVRELLDAYVDDEAAPAEVVAMREHLASCTACAREVQRRESLRQLLRGVPYHPAPDRLRLRVRRERTRFVLMRLAAAACVVLAAGTSVFVFREVRSARATSTLAEAVIDRHVASLMSGDAIVVRSSNQHTVKPWFQGRIDFSPPVVDLESAGFPLLGGRVETVDGRRVAAVVYGRRDHVIDVFIWPDGDASPGDARTVRGFQERHWRAADMSLWAVSDLNGRELDDFVRAFQAAAR